MVSEKYLLSKFKKRIKEQQSCLYLDQISASSGFVRNTLQKTCRRNKFLASMCLFKLVCLCESYQRHVVRDNDDDELFLWYG